MNTKTGKPSGLQPGPNFDSDFPALHRRKETGPVEVANASNDRASADSFGVFTQPVFGPGKLRGLAAFALFCFAIALHGESPAESEARTGTEATTGETEAIEAGSENPDTRAPENQPTMKKEQEGYESTQDTETLELEPLRAEVRYTLEQVMRKAQESPAAVQAAFEAKASGYDVESLENTIYLPRIGAGYTYEIKDKRLSSIDTPLGPVGGLRKDFGQAALNVEQTLFDTGATLYRLPAARFRRDAALSGAALAQQQAALKAARDYFTVLRLEARQAAVAELVNNLSRRYNEMYRLYRFGRVSSVDLTRVRLALSDAQAGLDTIRRSIGVARLALGQSIGESREVAVVMPEWNLPTAEMARRMFGPEFANISQRQDLQALQKQIQAQELEKEELEHWTLPVFFARASLIHDNSGQITQRNWAAFQAGVQLPLYESGSRETRRKAAEERLKALKARRSLAIQGYRLELESRLLSYETAIRETARLQRDFGAARQAAYTARVRFSEGQGTPNEVLDAENLLFDTYDRYGQARIDSFLSYYELAFSAGQLLRLGTN